MKVVFVQDVTDVAQAGEVKNVANGHARNYLFPKGFAVPATPNELKRVEARQRALARQREEQKEGAAGMAGTLQDVSLTFSKRAGAKGNMYGSVSATAIYQELKSLGHAVEKPMIKLEDPIRKFGTHEVQISLMKDVTATIKVTIEQAEQTEEDQAEEVTGEATQEQPEATIEETTEESTEEPAEETATEEA